MFTERTIIQKLKEFSDNENSLYPLIIKDISFDFNEKKTPIDGSLVLEYKKKKYSFNYIVKYSSSLKVYEQAISSYNKISSNKEKMIIIPYLDEKKSAFFENTDISCIDLNGNYLIQAQGLAAVRLDRPNRFKLSEPIKKVYSQNSSIVSRFLLKENKIYNSINDIYEGIQSLGGGINLSTVSKVIKQMENDLILEKSKNNIRLLQPDKLIQFIQNEYTAPKITNTLNFKLPVPAEKINNFLNKQNIKCPWVRTGESSAEYYTATTISENISIYVKDIGAFYKVFKEYENSRFYNCTVYETESSFIYFDVNKNWSSKIQTLCELSRLDKREKELAGQIVQDILRGFND